MSSPNPTRPESDAARTGGSAATIDDLDGPPVEEDFWKKYNAHLEFPIGTAISVLAHVLIVAVLVTILFGFWRATRDSKPVPIMNLGGEDDEGVGSPGEGDPNPVEIGQTLPTDVPRPDINLEQVKEEVTSSIRLTDPLDNFEIPDPLAYSLGALDKQLRDKLVQGLKKGDGTGGVGPGGTGADATRARGLRWVLRFNTKSGQDYLNQLRALRAVVMIPVPPKNDRMFILRDLANPRVDQYATDADIAEQSTKIQFQDVRKESNEAIAEALRLPKVPTAFWAFFPKELEEEMARKEVAYQNKRPEDIRETVYQVIITGGEPRLQVVRQRLK